MVASDAPALLLPNGRVLLAVAGANTPAQFAEYDPVTNLFVLVGSSAASGFKPNAARMLMLPGGDALVSLGDGRWFDVQIATAPQPQWAPQITTVPTTVNRGASVFLMGKQLNGLCEVSSFGHDDQQGENYPIAKLVSSTGTVRYLHTYDVTHRSIAPNHPALVLVDFPADLAPGSYTLSAVAMGIASSGVAITLR